MKFADPDLEDVAQRISPFTAGQLRNAVRYLLHEYVELAEQMCDRIALTAQTSREQDVAFLWQWFLYDIKPGLSEWLHVFRDSELEYARHVVLGALMVIGTETYRPSDQHILKATEAVVAAEHGKLYQAVQVLLAGDPTTADAVCNQAWLRLRNDTPAAEERYLVGERLGFWTTRKPTSVVQAALLLLGLFVREQLRGRSSAPPMLVAAQPPLTVQPVTSGSATLLLVVRGSKLPEQTEEGQTLTVEQAEHLLREATYFTCLEPKSAERLQGQLRLQERSQPDADQDVYAQLLIVPGAGLLREATKFGLLQALREAEAPGLKLATLRRLDTRASAAALAQFRMS